MILTIPVNSDTILSEDKMAIGTVEISCPENISYAATGFCEKLFRKINLDDGSIELQLFDLKPNYTSCSIDCQINRAEIYDYKGNLLNISITRGNYTRKNENQDIDYNESNGPEMNHLHKSIFIGLIFVLLLSFSILFFKSFKSRDQKR